MQKKLLGLVVEKLDFTEDKAQTHRLSWVCENEKSIGIKVEFNFQILLSFIIRVKCYMSVYTK